MSDVATLAILGVAFLALFGLIAVADLARR
jgi:hypothetical protein